MVGVILIVIAADLKKVKKLGRPCTILTNLYRCTTESVLSACITDWFGSCTATNRKTLEAAEQITGVKLQNLEDMYQTHCLRKTHNILADCAHPTHNLSSYYLLDALKAHSHRFYLQDIKLLHVKCYLKGITHFKFKGHFPQCHFILRCSVLTVHTHCCTLLLFDCTYSFSLALYVNIVPNRIPISLSVCSSCIY